MKQFLLDALHRDFFRRHGDKLGQVHILVGQLEHPVGQGGRKEHRLPFFKRWQLAQNVTHVFGEAEIEKSIFNIAVANQKGQEHIRYHAYLDLLKDGHRAAVTCCAGTGTRLYGSLPEFLYSLAPDGVYVDATFGRGGHSRGILGQLGPGGSLLVVDRDPAAVESAMQLAREDARLTPVQGSFGDLRRILMGQGLMGSVDGMVLDLGVSSPQFDDAERGGISPPRSFSFVGPAP